MLIVEVLVVLGVLSAVAVVVAGRGGAMSPPVRDTTDIRLPPEEVTMDPADVDALRFGLAFRGYRMDQVDEALDRLRDELRSRDERIAALTRQLGGRGAAAPAAAAAAAAPASPAPPAASTSFVPGPAPAEPAVASFAQQSRSAPVLAELDDDEEAADLAHGEEVDENGELAAAAGLDDEDATDDEPVAAHDDVAAEGEAGAVVDDADAVDFSADDELIEDDEDYAEDPADDLDAATEAPRATDSTGGLSRLRRTE